MDKTNKGKDPASPRPCDVPMATQVKDIGKARKKTASPALNQKWYVVSAKWYESLNKYHSAAAESSVPSPGPITNAELISERSPKDSPQLKPGLQIEADYVVVNEYEWDLLNKWFGGGPSIPRKVIAEGEAEVARVEVYLLDLIIIYCDSNGSPKPDSKKYIFLSKKTTGKDLLLEACKLGGVDPRLARIWNYDDEKNPSTLEDLDKTLFDHQLIYGQKILIEKRKQHQSWPRDMKSAPAKKKSFFSRLFGPTGSRSGSFGGTSSVEFTMGDSTDEEHQNLTKGLTGLRNLGNTCFMNSALQCLSNTVPLREYFVEGKFKNEVNKSNPLGMKGAIAENFGGLLREMWDGTHQSVNPKSLKHVIGKYAPTFEGFNQQDSQELLSFLMDGLHEDLNRITKKPYVEKKEADGRADEVVAKEAWDVHLLRNRSVMVDLFHGLFKSTVTCPECNKVSVTFDPFAWVSLPLVQEAERVIEITIVRYRDTKTPVKYAVRVSKHGKVAEVRQAIAELIKVPPQNLILCYIEDHRINYTYKDEDNTSLINLNELLIGYEVPGTAGGEVWKPYKLMHRKRKRSSQAYMSSSADAMGLPLLLSIQPGVTTGRDLYGMVFESCERFIQLPVEDKEDSEDDADRPTASSFVAPEIPRAPTQSLPPQLTNLNSMPFRIAMVSTSGNHCIRCGSACDGCIINPDDKPLSLPAEVKAITFAVDWERYFLDTFFDEDEALSVRLNKTVTESRKELKQLNSTSVDDCMKMFTTNERLGPDDPWYCPQCKEHRRAWKKFDLWKLPEILVVHLKRFQYNRSVRSKLTFDVDFPLEDLDLDKYILNEAERGQKYDLFAISNHMGGLGGGHYTAYAKNAETGEWYSFNDSSVTPVKKLDNLKSNSAYILFYRRKPKGSSSTETSSASQANGVGNDEKPNKKKKKRDNSSWKSGGSATATDDSSSAPSIKPDKAPASDSGASTPKAPGSPSSSSKKNKGDTKDKAMSVAVTSAKQPIVKANGKSAPKSADTPSSSSDRKSDKSTPNGKGNTTAASSEGGSTAESD